MCVGQRGGGHSLSHHCMLVISYIKAHGTQCSEENAGNMTEMTILVCVAVQAAVQLRATNAASMKAQ